MFLPVALLFVFCFCWSFEGGKEPEMRCKQSFSEVCVCVCVRQVVKFISSVLMKQKVSEEADNSSNQQSDRK